MMARLQSEIVWQIINNFTVSLARRFGGEEKEEEKTNDEIDVGRSV